LLFASFLKKKLEDRSRTFFDVKKNQEHKCFRALLFSSQSAIQTSTLKKHSSQSAQRSSLVYARVKTKVWSIVVEFGAILIEIL